MKKKLVNDLIKKYIVSYNNEFKNYTIKGVISIKSM